MELKGTVSGLDHQIESSMLIIKRRHLVSLGALLTILALAFDTFTQQVLSVDSRDVIGGNPIFNNAGDVPRSVLMDQYEHGSTRTGKQVMSYGHKTPA